MRKLIIPILCGLLLVACENSPKKAAQNVTTNTEVPDFESGEGAEEEMVGKMPENKEEVQTANPPSDDANQITVDRSYFETHKGTTQIQHDDSKYDKYGITSLNCLGVAKSFVYDNMEVSFSIISEIELYDNLRSLIIRGETEHTLGIWLVNYDTNHKYIDSYQIGYDEWAEGASWRTSVIHIQPEPYIEQEYVNWEDKENSSIEILKSGKFNVTKTVHSKHEM